jgi:hypothetical protein
MPGIRVTLLIVHGTPRPLHGVFAYRQASSPQQMSVSLQVPSRLALQVPPVAHIVLLGTAAGSSCTAQWVAAGGISSCHAAHSTGSRTAGARNEHTSGTQDASAIAKSDVDSCAQLTVFRQHPSLAVAKANNLRLPTTFLSSCAGCELYAGNCCSVGMVKQWRVALAAVIMKSSPRATLSLQPCPNSHDPCGTWLLPARHQSTG